MADILSITVALLAILQLFLKIKGWSKKKKILCLIVLGAVSVLIYSFGNSFATMEDPPPKIKIDSAEDTVINYNEGTIVNSTTNEYHNEYYNANPQSMDTNTSSPANSTQSQSTQDDTIANSQAYSIYRSDKFVDLKRGKHYPYICNPEINNCLGFTMKFSYELAQGNYVKNVWLVCVRENGDEWVQVDEITINEGEEKEFTIRFDRAISFTEIVVQRPVDYNGYINTDSLSIYDVVYK